MGKKNNPVSIGTSVRCRAPLRFIALHGHAMSGESFKKKIGSIRNEVKKTPGCEFYFPDGPIIASDVFGIPEKKGEGVFIDASEEKDEDSSPGSTPSSFSWIDFWSCRENADEKGNLKYLRVAESLHSLSEFCKSCREDEKKIVNAEISNSVELTSNANCNEDISIGGDCPFDGFFAFSQGTCIMAIWIAILLRQKRLDFVDYQRMNKQFTQDSRISHYCQGDVPSMAADICTMQPTCVLTVGDDIPIEEWRLPPHMDLFAPSRHPLCPSIKSTLTAFHTPLYGVNVSGLIPKDNLFGPFVVREFKLFGELRQSMEEYYSSKGTVVPLMLPKMLNVYGESDDLIIPEQSRKLSEAYDGIMGNIDDRGIVTSDSDIIARPTDMGDEVSLGHIEYNYPQSSHTVSNSIIDSVIWTHEGGHVVPAALRKPFKAFLLS